MVAHNVDFQKLRTTIIHWLDGKEWHMALKALMVAEQHHSGLRKDGVTPEFHHQLSQVNYLRPFIGLMDDPEGTITTVILHDILEDVRQSDSAIFTVGKLSSMFPNHVVASVEAMSKYDDMGRKMDDALYYEGIAHDVRASVAKGADRLHNHQTMIGVFSDEKQKQYLEFTQTFVDPMLKLATQLHPSQFQLYYAIRHSLSMQMELIGAILNSSK